MDLVNCFFDYSITRSNLALQHYKSDSFIYITSKRYISDKFYGIMIDTGAFRQSTAGYRQYFAYKKDVTSI